jgi:hypothetical protein
VSFEYLAEKGVIGAPRHVDLLVNHREQARRFCLQQIKSLTIVDVLNTINS